MKTVGLVGGISWVSTLDYYKAINVGINEKLGGLNFSKCIINSVNYAEVKKNNDARDWDAQLALMLNASRALESAGAEAILLCANTMHIIAGELEKKLKMPLIQITTETAKAIGKKHLKTVALLGTKFTMEMDFFTSKLEEQGIKTIIPGQADRDFIHYTIFEELGRNIFTDETRRRYISIIHELATKDAEGIILGCTEIPMLIKPEDVTVPLFDTVQIHAQAAVDFSLS